MAKSPLFTSGGLGVAPCVAELPEYQKFHARYLDDPAVEVISISNDISMSIARDVLDTFMVENEYDFTVLVDDRYVQKAGVNAFPTTWFVDGDGYIQFVQIGGGKRLASGGRVRMARRGAARCRREPLGPAFERLI